jgi:hypothetical protein
VLVGVAVNVVRVRRLVILVLATFWTILGWWWL